MRELLCQRMLGGKHQEGRTKERIGARRKDGNIGGHVTLCSCRGLIKGEADLCSLTAANPVGLSLLNLIWPVERGDIGQELVGVLSNLEEPLLHWLLYHHFFAAPAPAIDHLLICQHGLVFRTPPLE